MRNGKKFNWYALILQLAVLWRNIMESPGTRKWLAMLAYAQPLFLAIITYVVASQFAAIGVDAHHDGIMFKPALDVAEGKMLFRDTFTQYGALVTLLQALSLKIFGHYLLVIKLQTAFFYALSIYFLWLIWKRIIPQWLATICGLLYVGIAPYWHNSPWWFLPWSSVYSLFFLVISLYLIILFIEKNAGYYLLAAGASVALTLWCRQPVGIFLFCSTLFFLICWQLFGRFAKKEFYRQATLFLTAFIVVNALFIAWLGLNHAFNDMYYQSFARAFVWAEQTSTSRPLLKLITDFFPTFIPPLRPYASYVWSALPIVCLIIFLRMIINNLRNNDFDKKQTIIFASVMVCLASWMQYYPVLCIRHTYWASAPMIGVFAYFIWDLFRNERTIFRIAIVLMIIGLFFHMDIADRIREGKIKLNKKYITLSYPKVLKDMQIPEHDALYLQAIASNIDKYFKQHPNGGLINYTGDGLYPTFAENTHNFHPFQLVCWAGLKWYPDYFIKFRDYANGCQPVILSNNKPILFTGYTLIGLYHEIYITEPAVSGSVWRITSITRGATSYSAPGYCLDMQLTHRNLPPETDSPSVDKKAGTDSLSRPTGEKSPSSSRFNSTESAARSIRSLIAVASDFKGVVKGAWYPLAQNSNSITLGYLAMATNNMPRPRDIDLKIPADGKCRLWMTGQDITNDTKITIAVKMNNNTYPRQTISILPPLSSGNGPGCSQPPELIPLRRNIRQTAETILKTIPDKAKVYLIWQGSNGYQYFMLAYELASHAVNREAWSLGQPCFEGDSWTSPMTPEAWSEILKQDHYDYVVVGQADEQFWDTYGKLFDDPEISRHSLVFKVKRPVVPVHHSPLGDGGSREATCAAEVALATQVESLWNHPEPKTASWRRMVNQTTNDLVRLSPVQFRRTEGTILPGDTMNVPLSSNTPQWIALKNTIALPITSGWTQVSSDSTSMTIPGPMFKSNGELMLYRDGQFKLATAISGGADCLRNCGNTNGWSLGYRDIAWKHNGAGLSFHFAAPGQINSAEISVQMRNYMDTNDVAARIAVSFDNGRTYRELPEKKTGFLSTNLLVWSSIVDTNTNKEVLVKVSAPLQNMYVGIDGVQAVFSGSLSTQLWETNDPPLEIKNEIPFPLELKKGGLAGGQEDWWESFFR